MSPTRLKEAMAKGTHPIWVIPPKNGERCPRCHRRRPPDRCALCRPQKLLTAGSP